MMKNENMKNETKQNNMNQLGNVCITIASRAAFEYLRVHNLKAEGSALAECLRAWIKIKLPEAIKDAQEAMACHMDKVADQTFAATIAQAGIEAAKEAGFPNN